MIIPGAILVQKGTVLPEPLRLDNGWQASGWTSVLNNLDRHQLEKELTTAGWTFFYMAGAIRTTAFGFVRQKMIDAALKRLIANVRLEKCNSLEIDDVETHSFLAMPVCEHLRPLPSYSKGHGLLGPMMNQTYRSRGSRPTRH